MIRLGVNIDHIATLRQVRGGIEPDPVFAAFIAQTAGADSIVVHLREDRRHIKDRDLYILKETVKTRLNLEMSLAEDIVRIAGDVKPDQATLVPEKRQEITTEGGLDVKANLKRIMRISEKFKIKKIGLSLFIDPERRQVDAAKKTGASIIELHTGRYANAVGAKERGARLKEIIACAAYARGQGLSVAAGHGLDYYNVAPIAGIKGIEELNIGYAIICRAALVGLEQAIREMRQLMDRSR